MALQGFSVDGRVSGDDRASSFVDKCVWVDSGVSDGEMTLEGFIMQDLSVFNCG